MGCPIKKILKNFKMKKIQQNQTIFHINIDNNTSFVEKIRELEFIFKKIAPGAQAHLPLN